MAEAIIAAESTPVSSRSGSLLGMNETARAWGIFAVLSLVVLAVRPNHMLAILVVYTIAVDAALRNDSTQTFGFFVSAFRNRPWIWTFLEFGAIAMAIHAWGWSQNPGDLAFGKLASFPQVDSFHPLQVLGPPLLFILSHHRFQVSNTICILSTFGGLKVMNDVTLKTAGGYVTALLLSLGLWIVIGAAAHFGTRWGMGAKIRRWSIWSIPFGEWIAAIPTSQRLWSHGLQCATRIAWVFWCVNDASQIMVFAPRKISPSLAVVLMGIFLAVLALILRNGFGRMEDLVTRTEGFRNEDSPLIQRREGTLVMAVNAVVMGYFLVYSQYKVSMSSSFVCIAALGGMQSAKSLIRWLTSLGFLAFREDPIAWLRSRMPDVSSWTLTSVGTALSRVPGKYRELSLSTPANVTIGFALFFLSENLAKALLGLGLGRFLGGLAQTYSLAP